MYPDASRQVGPRLGERIPWHLVGHVELGLCPPRRSSLELSGPVLPRCLEASRLTPSSYQLSFVSHSAAPSLPENGFQPVPQCNINQILTGQSIEMLDRHWVLMYSVVGSGCCTIGANRVTIAADSRIGTAVVYCVVRHRSMEERQEARSAHRSRTGSGRLALFLF